MLQHPGSDRRAAQVLVYHDLLGMMQHPHYVKVTPKFCKQFASVGVIIQEALQSYKDEVGHPVLTSCQQSDSQRQCHPSERQHDVDSIGLDIWQGISQSMKAVYSCTS